MPAGRWNGAVTRAVHILMLGTSIIRVAQHVQENDVDQKRRGSFPKNAGLLYFELISPEIISGSLFRCTPTRRC